MPRVIDFGAPYGTREFPDDTSDEQIVAEYDRVRSENLTPRDYLQQAGRSIIRGAAGEVAAIPKAIGIGAGELRRLVGYVPGFDVPTREGEEFSTAPQASEAYRLGQLIERGAEAISPPEVPALRESFVATQAPQAVGSGLGFLLGGGATRLLRRAATPARTLAVEEKLAEAAAKKGASLPFRAGINVAEGAEIGTLGATSQFQSEYDKAIQAGADRDTALKAGLIGLPIGATEAIPLSNMLRRLDRFSEGGFSRYLLTAGKEAFEEALQEAAQNFASNAVEKGLYNEAKSLTDDLIPQAGAGGAAGFLLSTLTQALGGARRLRKGAEEKPYADRSRTQPATTGEQTQELVQAPEGQVRLRGPAQPRVEAQAGTPEAIIAALKPFGVALSPQLTIFNDPSDTAPAARTQFDENNVFQRIELNQAKLPNETEVQNKLFHELAHVGSDSGALSGPLNLLTPVERGDIAKEMARLGYPTGSQNEFDARGTEALISAWSGRSWFGQLVGRVTAWANEAFGIKLTRRAAEAIAVRAVGRSLQQLRQPAPRYTGTVQLGNAFLTPPGLTRAEAALTAHHGTPHEVDRFSTSKIGTGEGAQVYGWGLYFAQNPQVARQYAENLAMAKPFLQPTSDVARARLERIKADAPFAIDNAIQYYDRLSDTHPIPQATEMTARQLVDAAAYARDRGDSKAAEGYERLAGDLRNGLSVIRMIARGGNEYTVSINANDDELLDWDKPLSEQSPRVKATIAPLLQRMRTTEVSRKTFPDRATAEKQADVLTRQIQANEARPVRRYLVEPSAGGFDVVVYRNTPDFLSGSNLYTQLASIYASPQNPAIFPATIAPELGEEASSQLLRSLGIKGIRYLDQGSRPGWIRKVDEDQYDVGGIKNVQSFNTRAEAEAYLDSLRTYNYVIFDENDINITHRNGQPVKASQLAQQRTEEAKAERIEKCPQGECFRGAWRWAADHENENPVIVNGKVTNGEGRTFYHSWVEAAGDVVDPTTGVRMEKQKWYGVVNAQPEASYTPEQYAINLARIGKHGPWTRAEVGNRFVTQPPETVSFLRTEEAKAEPTGPPPIQGAQVAGAAAQLGRVAEEAYAKRERATTQLSGLAYERQQYKAARQELRRLTEVATGRLFQEGFTIEDNPGYFPDPTEGVGIEEGQVVVGDEFINKLNAAGINPDIENTQSLQGEVYFEREAHRLVSLRAQIDTLQRAMGYYAALGVEQAEIDKIQETINKLSNEANKLAEAELEGRTIGQRADEIQAADAARPGLLAQRNSLGLDPVVEFFGRQVGGYREFVEKVRQGLRLAAALRDKATTPQELRDAVQEMTGWLALPEEVRDAALSGRGLTDEQRGAAFARLAEAFEDFDIQRQAMGALKDSRIQIINQRVRQLLDLISSAKIKEGMQEVLIADVLAALDGETGGTGTLQSQATAQALKQNVSAIKIFAENLGKNIELNGALFNWLVNPSGPAPSGTALGVSQQTLDMILAEVKKNPAFGSAVVTLINAADKKLANLPIVQLQEIQQALQAGESGQAQTLAQKMIASAKARASLMASSQRQNLRELEKLDIERQALEQGEAMFNEVASSPEYRQLRDVVSNSPYGLIEPMDVGNNTTRTFRPFGAKELPSHEGLKLDAADSPELKSEDFVRVHRWMKAAQEHLDAYDAAQAAYDADPANNPSPASLGFDLPVVRGLRDAVRRSVPGSAQVLSTQSEGSRWKVPWLVRVMNKTGWFRQHDFVAKMVGGTAGTDLRAKLGDWINHFLISRSVSQKYRDIPALRHAAMKSHPEVQMNFQNYRAFWNELAHWGRIFGSPLRVGFVLPGSGRAVTAEDLALLKRETEFEEDLRRKVTETSPVFGVRIKKGNREFVRAGAYVGDRGLPRHLNQRATAFINRIMRAYGDNGGFDISSDLGPASTNPVVAFWNTNPSMLVQHVLDSTRQDRAMRIDPLMAQAERTAAADWMANAVPSIHSIDELVTELVRHFPTAPGLNIREKVVEGLNNELNQYNMAARRIDSERRQRDAERNSKVQISFSADNEFTRPAAQLELPSELYDYGALSDTDHMLIQSRANHERVVAYALALQRARADLQQRLQAWRDSQSTSTPMSEKEAFHGGTVDEAKDVLGILNKLYDDFDAAYKMGSPALTQGGWLRDATGLLTSAVLALPTVNLRNMTQGQFEVYTMSQAMGLGGQRMLFARALLNMPKTLARYALHIGSGIAKRADLGATMLTGKNHQMFTKLVDAIAKMMFQGNYRASADRVHELGFDTREGFLERMRRLWQATAESAQAEDLSATKIGGRRLGRLLGLTPNALKALFDTIGVQESDLTINASLLNYATMLEKRLQEVAMEYGAERERQGLTAFDPTDPRWKLKPDEWAGGNQQAAKDSLALFELFIEQAASAEGFQLEKNLWDYYQRAKAGPTRLFTERQFDAVQRGLLAQFNASTPANRASAAAGNNVVRNLLTLQGYVSDGLLKLLNAAIGGTRDRAAISGALAKLPIIGLLSLMSVLIGYMVGGITGEWEKRIRGRAPSLPTPFDADFWTSWKRWGEGTKRLALAQLFYLGDVLLAINGEISGNRGFDPAGRLFPLALIQRALNALRGMWKTQPEASFGQRLQPGKDVLRSLVPWVSELENVFNQTVATTKQSERVIRGEAQIRELLPEGRGSQSFLGPQYGPTTIVRRDLMEAVSKAWEAQQKGDAGAQAQAIDAAKVELQKLQAYYAAKYIKAGDTPERANVKAQQDLWRDYQELNPVVAGMLGKRPTKAEYDLIRSGITGERAQVVDNGIAAWQAGAQALFGRAAPITREDVAAGRGGGGGFGRGGAAGIPSAIPRGISFGRRAGIGRPRAVGGLRRVGLARGPRLPAARTIAPRSLRRGGGALGIRSIGLRRPGIRRTTLPGVRRISAGRRRIGVVPRRRRRQATAA